MMTNLSLKYTLLYPFTSPDPQSHQIHIQNQRDGGYFIKIYWNQT